MQTATQRNPRPSLALRLAEPLLQALATPHPLDRYLEQIDPMWALSELRARIVGVEPEAGDCITLSLRPNRRWAGFRAGQFLRLSVEVNGVRRTRCYSLSASAHRSDGLLQLTVKRKAGGRVSDFLHREARPGMVLGISQAQGAFCLPDARPQRLLFISGGSGITPLMGMLRTLCDEGHAGRIAFLHYAPTPQEVTFGEELEALAARHPNLELLPAYTRADVAGALRGHFSLAQLRLAVPDFADCSTFVCGPAGLMQAVASTWTALGLQQHLRSESFGDDTPIRVERNEAPQGEVRFLRSERLAANDGRTLLDQAESAGLRPESGCRMGICHSCTCRKTAGRVRNLRSGEVSGSDDESIQLCISVPVGDVTLDL